MIHKIGFKTTTAELVAYKVLEPGANEGVECAQFRRRLQVAGADPRDPTMVLYIDAKEEPGCRKEVLVPVARMVEGYDSRVMEKMRVAFLVFMGGRQPVEHYYEKLYEFIGENGAEPASRFCSIEAVYQPHEFNLSYGSFIDEDTPEHWSTEILIPVKE